MASNPKAYQVGNLYRWNDRELNCMTLLASMPDRKMYGDIIKRVDAFDTIIRDLELVTSPLNELFQNRRPIQIHTHARTWCHPVC
jgi:hypothetical protein